VKPFLLLNRDKHDKLQLSAKLKKILLLELRGTLNFRKIEGGKIKGFFNRSYCRSGKLLCHKGDHNLFANNWTFM